MQKEEQFVQLGPNNKITLGMAVRAAVLIGGVLVSVIWFAATTKSDIAYMKEKVISMDQQLNQLVGLIIEKKPDGNVSIMTSK